MVGVGSGASGCGGLVVPCRWTLNPHARTNSTPTIPARQPHRPLCARLPRELLRELVQLLRLPRREQEHGAQHADDGRAAVRVVRIGFYPTPPPPPSIALLTQNLSAVWFVCLLIPYVSRHLMAGKRWRPWRRSGTSACCS